MKVADFIRDVVLLLWCIAGADGIETRQNCVDSLSNCENYGTAACSQYQAWAQQNCARFCGFCNGGTQPNQAACTDVIDNCAALGPNTCQNYVEFASINCAHTCNLCGSSGSSGTSSTSCADTLSNCADYGPASCTGQYLPWAKDNCMKTCNLCPNGSGGTGTFSDVCFYNGQVYKEGQQWTEGCEKNCTCVDQRKGYYLCQEICPKYNNLPADCQMVTQPGECCAKPVCPSSTGCDYKGQIYTEGQAWKDGCDFYCTCKNGQQGYYECRALCVHWDLLPVCHLDNPVAGKCCPTPNCPANVVIQYPPGYVPE